MSKIVIIGAGFAGLAASSYLAKAGHEVVVVEKNEAAGGRASIFFAEGFTFDMGPSWYWMPEVFESFFNDFGHHSSDFYSLKRLDPSYQIFYKNNEVLNIPAGMEPLMELFESMEEGAGEKLKQFLKEAQYKYEVGMSEFVWKPGHSIMEFADLRILKSAVKLQMFSSISSQIRKLFKHPQIIQMLEFPVLFLGARPQETPALYSLMNYADIGLGTWYPEGGMYEVPKAMYKIALEQNVRFYFNEAATEVVIKNSKAVAVKTSKHIFDCDYVIGSGDYHHIDRMLLGKNANYSESYWDKRVMAPSSLLFYLGVNKRVGQLEHHNLFFDQDFELHAKEIYTTPTWPTNPLFYACVPSKSDESVAPAGMENIFLLMPLAPDLEDSTMLREKYFDIMMDRMERILGQNIKEHIVYKRSFAMNDFKSRYNAYKGNAYGLANTLKQTAFLKPKLKHKKIANIFFAGQLTTPGPGVPPSIISGCVAASEIIKIEA